MRPVLKNQQTLVNQNAGENIYRCPSCGAELECAHREEQVCVGEREAIDSNRVFVRIRSYRCRLLDRDNLFPKYFIDALRYSGIIRDDTTRHIAIDVDQEKVETKEEERTEIELVYPSQAVLVNHNPRPLF